MASTIRPATSRLNAVVAPLIRWIDTRRNVERLRSKSPDQREDLGLTLRDMAMLGR